VAIDKSDDRVRQLCAEALKESDSEKLAEILGELREILHIRVEQARKLAAAVAEIGKN
jgi:hypothetical protein